MLVVSDSTLLNILIRLSVADILPALYDRVVIPPAVQAELSHPHTPAEIRSWFAGHPTWLSVVTPSVVNLSISGPGEREAIALALELHADYLLIDDKEARSAARRLNLNVTGTVGILEFAGIRKLIDLPAVLHRLPEAGFFIDHRIIEAVLARHRERAQE